MQDIFRRVALDTVAGLVCELEDLSSLILGAEMLLAQLVDASLGAAGAAAAVAVEGSPVILKRRKEETTRH